MKKKQKNGLQNDTKSTINALRGLELKRTFTMNEKTLRQNFYRGRATNFKLSRGSRAHTSVMETGSEPTFNEYINPILLTNNRSNSNSRMVKYMEKAKNEQTKLNAMVDGRSISKTELNRDVEFLRDMVMVRDQKDAYKQIRLSGKDASVKHAVPVRALMKVLYQLKRLKMLYEATLLVVLFFTFGLSLILLTKTNLMFEQNAILHELFVDEEVETANFKKT